MINKHNKLETTKEKRMNMWLDREYLSKQNSAENLVKNCYEGPFEEVPLYNNGSARLRSLLGQGG